MKTLFGNDNKTIFMRQLNFNENEKFVKQQEEKKSMGNKKKWKTLRLNLFYEKFY